MIGLLKPSESFVQRDYRGLSSVTETSQLSNLSMAGIILLFSATDDISSSLFCHFPTTQKVAFMVFKTTGMISQFQRKNQFVWRFGYTML